MSAAPPRFALLRSTLKKSVSTPSSKGGAGEPVDDAEERDPEHVRQPGDRRHHRVLDRAFPALPGDHFSDVGEDSPQKAQTTVPIPRSKTDGADLPVCHPHSPAFALRRLERAHRRCHIEHKCQLQMPAAAGGVQDCTRRTPSEARHYPPKPGARQRVSLPDVTTDSSVNSLVLVVSVKPFIRRDG